MHASNNGSRLSYHVTILNFTDSALRRLNHQYLFGNIIDSYTKVKINAILALGRPRMRKIGIRMTFRSSSPRKVGASAMDILDFMERTLVEVLFDLDQRRQAPNTREHFSE